MPRLRCPALVLLLLCLWGCSRRPPPGETAPVRVAAAANLMLAFEALAPRFRASSGQAIEFSFGSSGLLAEQLGAGAPFDLFVAADLGFAASAVASGACDGTTTTPYARGRLVLWSAKGGVEPPRSVRDLAEPRFTRVAIAQPEHAPYGKAAVEALTTAGVWERVQPKLVFGENVRQAHQFAATGNVEVALVALALVAQDRANPWTLVDASEHTPIEQALVVCGNGLNRAGAEAFRRFLDTPETWAILEQHGFERPGPKESASP